MANVLVCWKMNSSTFNSPPPAPLPVAPAPAPPTPKVKRPFWKTCLFVAGIGVLALLGLGLLGYVASIGDEFELSDQQKLAVFTFDRVDGIYDGIDRSEYTEVWTAKKLLDDSIEVNYDCEKPGDDGIYISSSIGIQLSESEAKGFYLAEKTALAIGLSAFGDESMSTVVHEDWINWGQETEVTLLNSGGSNYGFCFIGRKGRRVYSTMVTGIVVEGPEDARLLLEQALEDFDATDF